MGECSREAAAAIVLSGDLKKALWQARNAYLGEEVVNHIRDALYALHQKQPDIGIKKFLDELPF